MDGTFHEQNSQHPRILKKRSFVVFVILSAPTAGLADSQGAPFTYDMEGYRCFVKSARTNVFSPVGFPTFEHHIKDPVPSPIPLLPSNRIVIIEGLYTILDEPGWSEISDDLDVSIYVDVSREVARERLIRRNFAAGIADTLEGTIQRGTYRVDI